MTHSDKHLILAILTIFAAVIADNSGWELLGLAFFLMFAYNSYKFLIHPTVMQSDN